MPLRDDEHVRGRLRVDVVERKNALVLVHDRGWDLTLDDLAEETVTHRRFATAVRAMPWRSRRRPIIVSPRASEINCSTIMSWPKPNSKISGAPARRRVAACETTRATM